MQKNRLEAFSDGVLAIITEVSRGIDNWLWFVEAHSQASN